MITPKKPKKITTHGGIIRAVVEDYYDLQTFRIALEGQLRSIDQKVATGEVEWLRTNIWDHSQQMEKEIRKRLKEWVESEPIYNYWLGNIKGIGPVLAAGLIALIEDIEKFPTISKLWMYAGLGVNDEGKAIRRVKGEKICYNPRFKVLAWKIGESFVKTKGGYRKLYEQCREEYDKKWLTYKDCHSTLCEKLKKKHKNKCMNSHRYAAAKRKTVKIFLAHLHMKWREMKHLPIEHPFIIGKKDKKGVYHGHEIMPLEN